MSGEWNIPYTGPTKVDLTEFSKIWARCFNCCRMVRLDEGRCPNCRTTLSVSEQSA